MPRWPKRRPRTAARSRFGSGAPPCRARTGPLFFQLQVGSTIGEQPFDGAAPTVRLGLSRLRPESPFDGLTRLEHEPPVFHDSSHELISLGHVSPFPEGRRDHNSPLVPDSDNDLFVHGAEWYHSFMLVAPRELGGTTTAPGV